MNHSALQALNSTEVCMYAGDSLREGDRGIRGDVLKENVPRPEFEGKPCDQEVPREGMRVVAHSITGQLFTEYRFGFAQGSALFRQRLIFLPNEKASGAE